LVTETVYLATGLLLPIWGALPKEDLTVNRIVDKSGASWLGRHVHDLYVDATLEKLGVAQGADRSRQDRAAILGGGTWKAPHPLNFTIRTSRVNGSRRIEIVGAEGCAHSRTQGHGCFTEIIAYKTRVFVPGKLGELRRLPSLGGVDARVLRRALIDNGYLELAVTSEHAVAISQLPPIHKDPFDRMLIAQSIEEGITLLTADKTVCQYPGPIREV
jgi:hypothetical protein